MKNPGWRLRRWRSRRCKIYEAARQSPGPATACGRTAPGGTVADEIMTGEIVASETGPIRAAAGDTVAAAMHWQSGF